MWVQIQQTMWMVRDLSGLEVSDLLIHYHLQMINVLIMWSSMYEKMCFFFDSGDAEIIDHVGCK